MAASMTGQRTDLGVVPPVVMPVLPPVFPPVFPGSSPGVVPASLAAVLLPAQPLSSALPPLSDGGEGTPS